MPSDTYHINASGNSFVHVGGSYQSGHTQHTKLLNYLLPSWQSNKSLELHWDYNQARQKHVDQTGEWIREPDEFQSWVFEPNSVLWLHGIAGCGKTVLSSTVIDYLQNSLSQKSNYTAGYYFNAREDEKRNVARLIRSLILQLVPTEGELPPQVQKLCDNPSQNLSDDRLLLALEELVSREGHTYIVIDALDECDTSFRSGEDSEVDKLDRLLLWLLEKSRNLHLLVTSRNSGLAIPVEQRLRSIVQNGPSNGLPHYAIDLQSGKIKPKIEHDIGELITSELKRWNNRKGRRWLPLSEEKQNLVTGVVLRRANGMFRLAACLLDLLWKKSSWDELELALNDLPSKLLEVYDRIFQDIEDQGQLETANILLIWLLYSERPLSLRELTDVTMVDTQGASFDIRRRPEDESYVSLTLSSFVTTSKDNLVQFAHQTVREYLVSEKTQHGRFSRNFECHAWIAKCCLSYMQYFAHNPEPEGDGFQISCKRLQLFEYVSNNWYRHALGAWINPEAGEDLDGKVSSTLSSSACLSDYSLPVANDDSECEDAGGSLSQWATAVKQWLDQTVCTQNAPHSSTLRVVACQGYEKCINMLFNNPTITAFVSEYCSELILKAAVIGVYDELIQIAMGGFLKLTWNKTSWWSAKGDPMAENQILEHQSHRAIIKLLLNHGVDVNSRDPEDGWTALHIAAFQGDKKMIELLLSHDADTSVTDNNGGTALHVASSQGHDSIVQLWLNEGLPFDTKDNLGWTALNRAVQRAVIELTVQPMSASDAVYRNPTYLESINPSSGVEYRGRPVTSQVLRSNNETVAQTISLILDAMSNDKAEEADTAQFIFGDSTESARSCRIQFDTIDEETSINAVAPSTTKKIRCVIGRIRQISIRGAYLKIGRSLMEDQLNGGQLLTPLFAPPVNSLQLHRRPRHFTTTYVGTMHIFDGTVDFIRSHIGHLFVREGAANFTMSYIDSLTIYEGSTTFLSAAQLGQCTIRGGSAVFSSTANLDTLEVIGGSATFSAVQLGQCTIRGGSAVFSSTANLDTLEVRGGSATFSAVQLGQCTIRRGSAVFSSMAKLDALVIRGGSVIFLSTVGLGRLVIYQGCATFSAGSHITNTKVYGGQINFLSSADFDRVEEYGGSLHFIYDIHREILRILLGGSGGGIVSTEERDAGTITTTMVRIRELEIHAGFFNLCSSLEVESFTGYGGILNFVGGRVMCLLAGGRQDALARLLLDKGANPSEIWPETRRLLLNGGLNIETSGWTALHEAAYRGQETFVQMLLENRADLCIQDGNGLTALQIATLQGHTAIVRLLEEEKIRADEKSRVLEGGQKWFRKYAQGIYNAFRFLTELDLPED